MKEKFNFLDEFEKNIEQRKFNFNNADQMVGSEEGEGDEEEDGEGDDSVSDRSMKEKMDLIF